MVWRRANITRRRKLALFDSCVISKLTYCLEAFCLRKADRDKIDAFQAICYRKILNIPHSMISHISNEEVRNRANSPRLSQLLLFRQLLLFGRISAMPNTALQATLFQTGTLDAAGLGARRRQGRPRLAWGPVVKEHARLIIEGALGPSPPLLRPPPSPPPLSPAPAPSPESAVLGIFFGPARYKKTVWKAMVKRHVFAM